MHSALCTMCSVEFVMSSAHRELYIQVPCSAWCSLQHSALQWKGKKWVEGDSTGSRSLVRQRGRLWQGDQIFLLLSSGLRDSVGVIPVCYDTLLWHPSLNQTHIYVLICFIRCSDCFKQTKPNNNFFLARDARISNLGIRNLLSEIKILQCWGEFIVYSTQSWSVRTL